MAESLEKSIDKNISIGKTSLDFMKGFAFGTIIGGIDQFILDTSPNITMNTGSAFIGSLGYYMALNKKKYSENARLSKSIAFYAGICTGTVIYSSVRNYLARSQ